MLNLIVNAAHAIEESCKTFKNTVGTIAISTRCTDDFVEIG